jgi:hypothetical protein
LLTSKFNAFGIKLALNGEATKQALLALVAEQQAISQF